MFPPFQRVTGLADVYARLAKATALLEELPANAQLSDEQRTRALEEYHQLQVSIPLAYETKAHIEIVRGRLVQRLFPDEQYLDLPHDRTRKTAYEHYERALRLIEQARGPERENPDPRDEHNESYCVLETQRLWLLKEIAAIWAAFFRANPKYRQHIVWRIEQNLTAVLNALMSHMCVEAIQVWYGDAGPRRDLQTAEGEVIGELVSLQMQAGLYLHALQSLARLRQHNEDTLKLYRECVAKLGEAGDGFEQEVALLRKARSGGYD